MSNEQVVSEPKLYDVRVSLGLSQKSAAKILGISQGAFSRLERGKTSLTEEEKNRIISLLKSADTNKVNDIDKPSESVSRVKKQTEKKKSSKNLKKSKKISVVEYKKEYKCPLIDILHQRDEQLSKLKSLVDEIRNKLN